MSQPGSAENALRYGSRYPSTGPSVVARACPVCGGTPPSSRSVYCKTACKQLAYRLRHQRLASVDPVVLRNQLQRQRLAVRRALPRRAAVFIVSAVLQSSGSGRPMRGLRSHHAADRVAGNVGRYVLMHSPREMGCGHAALLTQSLDNLPGSGGPLQVAHIPTPVTAATTALRP